MRAPGCAQTYTYSHTAAFVRSKGCYSCVVQYDQGKDYRGYTTIAKGMSTVEHLISKTMGINMLLHNANIPISSGETLHKI